MNTESYNKLFQLLPEEKASPKLFNAVIARVERRETLFAQVRALFHATCAALSVAAAIPVIGYIISASQESGLSAYVSLALSDSTYALSNWKALILSIADSVPLMSGMAFVLILIIFANAVRSIAFSRPFVPLGRGKSMARFA